MRLRSLLAAGLFAVVVAMPAAAVTLYTTALTGANENPSNASPATGTALVTIDELLMTMRVEVTFAGLIGGNASAAHIHCCTAAPANVGVATGLPGFPGTTSGAYDHLFDMTNSSVYSAAFLANFGGGTAAGAFNALVLGLDSGMAYLNIHNAAYPGGEIRGFLHAIPEPQTYALMAVGLVALGWVTRRRRSGLTAER